MGPSLVLCYMLPILQHTTTTTTTPNRPLTLDRPDMEDILTTRAPGDRGPLLALEPCHSKLSGDAHRSVDFACLQLLAVWCTDYRDTSVWCRGMFALARSAHCAALLWNVAMALVSSLRPTRWVSVSCSWCLSLCSDERTRWNVAMASGFVTEADPMGVSVVLLVSEFVFWREDQMQACEAQLAKCTELRDSREENRKL